GRGMSRPVRSAACLVAVLLGCVAFAGTAFADDESGRDGLDRSSQFRSDDTARSDSSARSDDSARSDRADSDSDESSAESRDSADSGESGRPVRGSRSARRPDDNLPDNIVRGTPCTDDAVACVSLGAQRAWLFTDGRISYGPVPVSTGGPGKQ